MAQGVMSTEKELLDRLEYEEWFRREVEVGLKQAEAGNLIDHETVMKKWLGKAEKPKDPRRKS
jgi:predicted transcriptional regulator